MVEPALAQRITERLTAVFRTPPLGLERREVALALAHPWGRAALIDALRHDEDQEVRSAAAKALEEAGGGGPEGNAVLLDLDRFQQAFLRRAAADELVKSGGAGPEGIAALHDRLQHDEQAVDRILAVLALGAAGG